VQLLLLGVAMAFIFVTKAMLEPLVPLLALSLGAPPSIVGALVAAPFLLPLFFAVSVGVLVDRRPPRRLITLGALALSVAPVTVVFFPSMIILALVQILIGLSHLILVISGQSLVAALGSGKERERNFGRYTTFLSAGQLVGPLVGGVLADMLGYRLAFGMAGVFALVGAVLSLFLSPSGINVTRNRERGLDLERVRSLLSKDGIKAALALSASVLFALGAYQAFFPVYLEDLNYPVTVIGLLLSLRALSALVVRPFTAKIIGALHGRFNTAFLMMLLAAIGVGMTGLVEVVVPLALASILIGIGWGITQPISMVTVTEQVKDQERGFALSMRITGNRLAQLSSPLLFGVLAEVSGISAAFIVGGSALFIASLFITRWGRYL
jgi:MFS family permease